MVDQPSPILEQVVGSQNEGVVYIDETKPLIDSGSMISTVTQEFVGQLVPEPTIHTLDDFDLEVKGVGGQILPYLGYVIVDVRVPFLEEVFANASISCSLD